MGHIIDAIQTLCLNKSFTFENSEQIKRLAITLQNLKSEIDKGYLAIGYIADNFNKGLKQNKHITPKAVGSLLRKQGFFTKRGHTNGKSGAFCLEWNEKVDLFIKQVLKVH